MKRFVRILILGVIAISLQGSMCQEIYTRDGTWYMVRSGDTINGIANRFGVSSQRIAHTNGLASSSDLQAGERIYIPNSHRSFASRGKNGVEGESSEARDQELAKSSQGRFAWPLEGTLTSKYGIRNGRRHDGIDVAAPRGTPVHASEAGEVVFSSRLRGYGNLILIKHEGDIFTVYAHNSRNLKKKGTKVEKGEVIARVGTTGRATGPHVHFEVRQGSQAKNPLLFLPSQGTKVASAGASGGP